MSEVLKRAHTSQAQRIPSWRASLRDSKAHGSTAPVRVLGGARLRDTTGFTIAEVLLAVALVGLLTMAVAAGIGVAMNAHGNIRMHSEGQAVLNNAVTAVTDELRFASDIEETTMDGSYPSPNINGTQAYVFNSATRGYRLYLGNGFAQDGAGQGIMLYAATAVPSASGAYESWAASAGESAIPLPLVRTEAGSEGSAGSTAESASFTATITHLSWDASSRMWQFSIEVTDGTYTTDTGEQPIQVRALNTW